MSSDCNENRQRRRPGLFVCGIARLRSATLAFAGHRRCGARIGLLAVDAPVAQLVEGDRMPGDGTTHEASWADDEKVAVEIFDLRLACFGGPAFDPVHRESSNSMLIALCHGERAGGTSTLRDPAITLD